MMQRRLQRPVAGSASISAPIGGWNARDSVADMEPNDAVYMTNWIPATSEVQFRNGYTQHATGIAGVVETIIAYNGPVTNKLFAAAGSRVYNVTTAGAVGTPDLTGKTNGRWQYTNYATVAGNYIRAVNGSDKSIVYDGTSWHVDGDGAPYDITGVNSQNLIHVNVFKERMWFVEKDSLNAWYLPAQALGGAAVKFPLQAVAKMGGYLMAMGTWTLDAGQGVDDYAVFVTSKGEIIIYQGTDPASVDTFFLKGVWYLGAPIGRRCLSKLGGDLLLICQDGLLPLSGALQSSRVNPRVALTDKIQWATSEAISNYGTNYGWQTIYFPKNNLLFLNVPISSTEQQQYVMNTITKAWCNFTGWAASCWELFNDEPYFGGNGFVGHAWNGHSDAGANISGTVKQAFNYFGSRGLLKRWTMMRPILRTDGTPSYLSGINVDFDDQDIIGIPPFVPTSYGNWDSGLWDQSTWGGGLNILKNWQGINGVGYCAAPKIILNAMNIQIRWTSTDLVMEKGAIL